MIVYIPSTVPPGTMKFALAAPLLTVAEVTAEPTCTFELLNTVNIAVPEFTVPAGLVAVAESVTLWLLVPKAAVAFIAAVAVAAGLTVSLWVLSLLVRKSVPGLYVA